MSFYLKKNNILRFNKSYYYILAILFFVKSASYADIVRPTTFDERPSCEKSNGMWRDFGNSCADKCEYKYQKYPYCSNGIFYSCDCGKNRCLYEDKCVLIQEYKKIHDQKALEEEKILEETKVKRLKRAKRFQTEYTNKLSGIYGVDPNYRDPNYDQRNRELPPNTFKSTNRMLIYNDIIKKRNDKILSIQKKYQDELELLEKAENKDQKRIDKLKQQLEEANNLKIIQPLKETSDQGQNISEADKNSNNQNAKNEPIVLQPIEENVSPESGFGTVKSPQEMIDRTAKLLESGNKKNSGDKSVEIKPNITDDKNNGDNSAPKGSSGKLPPVYIKQQNGEDDFKNGSVIDNSSNFPQFVN